jgi:PAS domain S-box-containing protein
MPWGELPAAPMPTPTEPADELARIQEALRHAEASRRESQAFLEKSFHANPALMAITRESDGRIVEVNPALVRATGIPRDEIVGRTSLELGLWADRDQREEFFRRLATEGTVRDLEADFCGVRGEIRSLLVNAERIELGGQPCVLTVGVDLTQRRRRDRIQAATYAISQAVLAGDDLPALLARIHCIIGGLMPAKNFYVALLSAGGTELSFPYFVDEYVPPPAPRALSNGFTEYVLHTARPALVTAAELPGLLRARGPYQPLDRPAAQRLGAPLLAGGRAIGVIALQDYHQAGAYHEEDLQLLNFVAEQTAVAVQRRQAEAALALAEGRYRSIFENAVEGLYLSTPDGRFLNVNPALARMFGYDSVPAMLAGVTDLTRQFYVKPGRRDEFFALFEHSDEVSDFESEVYRRDGSTFWISESVRLVHNAAGGIEHFEGVAIDVTERHAAARALEAAKEAADAASRAKSYFLASVSHELRTPLNGILGYTQILRRDGTLSEKQRHGIDVIHESADHLLALINDILDFSKIEAGRIELHAADFNLPEFAAGVERVFAPRAKEKAILFEIAVSDQLPQWVRGDEQRLRQVVFNLVANAVKFTRAGGVVFSVQQSDADTIRFSVSDTGIGIATSDLGKLFEPFSQVGNKASAAASGTGLGLAISRSLVERMGGRLNVESEPGRGSRFWFELALPKATCDGALDTPTATAGRVVGYEGARRRVLIVDDNTANRAVVVDMLAPLDFELVEAVDGPSALERAARCNPDLVLMDLRLPGMDGLEAVRRLRATELARARAARRLSIVAVSASAYDLDRRACFEAGCNDFLAKPFREQQLWNTIERVLGLTWRYEAGESRTTCPVAAHPPPPAEAAAIYELAARGDVVGIRARAEALLASDPRHAAFAHSLLELTARFRMKAIREFVAPYTSVKT